MSDEEKLISMFRSLPDEGARDLFFRFVLRVRNGDLDALRLGEMVGSGLIPLSELLKRM